jgi:hypothetical protein
MSTIIKNNKIYTIKLVECDKTFEIEGSKLFLSNLLKDMINENDDNSEEIPIMKCDETTFLKVKEFMDHYFEEPMNEVPKPVPQNAKVGDIVQPFYSDFIFGESIDLTLEQEKMIYNLFIISNFLDMKSLFSLCCLKTAIMMRNADKEKLAKMFNDNNDENDNSDNIVISDSSTNMEESN